MTVKVVGGVLKNGHNFFIDPGVVHVHFTLQPGDSQVVTPRMLNDAEDVEHFHVYDGIGTEWKASSDGVKKAIAKKATKKNYA